MKKYVQYGLFWLIALIICAGLCKSAFALNAVGQPVDSNYANKTYSIQVNDFTPVSGATDILTIQGAANKTIRISRIEMIADASAASFVDFYAYKRTAANTGGTKTNPIPVQHDSGYPVANTVTNSGFVVGDTYVISATSTACNSIGAANNNIGTNFVATATSASTCIAKESAKATASLYSANATTLGYGQLIRGTHYATPATALTGYPGSPWIVDFGLRNEQQIVLRGENEALAISLNGGWTGTPAGLNAYITVTWTEE